MSSFYFIVKCSETSLRLGYSAPLLHIIIIIIKCSRYERMETLHVMLNVKVFAMQYAWSTSHPFGWLARQTRPIT